MEEAMKTAIEIVKAQASVRAMTSEEMSSMIANLAKSITAMSTDAEPVSATPAMDSSKAIRERSVICLECNKSFKVITKRHLDSHGLTPAEYREKHGIKKGVALVCKSLQRERKKRMIDMALWERRKIKPGSSKPEFIPAKNAQNDYMESAFPGKEEII